MKNGLIFEDGELVYYKDDHLYHAGAIEVDGNIYYIGSKGKAVKGQHIVHSEMANGILKRGTYTFGEDYKLVKNSYIAPKKRGKHRRKQTKQSRRKRSGKPMQKVEKWLLVCVAVVILSSVVLVLVGINNGRNVLPDHEQKQTTAPKTVEVILPTFEDEVLLCSGAAKQLYDGQLTIETAVATGDPYRYFTFEYSLTGTHGSLFLSEKENLSNPKEYILDENKKQLIIDNLKTGTTYYYKVTVAEQQYAGSFTTAKSTRFLSAPGWINRFT